MSGTVLYTTRWNEKNRRPIAGHAWIDPETARQRVDAGDNIEIVDGASMDPDGVPRPRWVIGWSSAGPRVQFYDEHGTKTRVVDYEPLDGRLWRLTTVDYAYADADERHGLSDVVVESEAEVLPDGTGHFSIENVVQRQESFSEFSGRANDAYWVEVPRFGEWDVLSDPGPSAAEVAGRESALSA
ncbi:hypothetical protein ACFT2C_06045 [Promicromonospora sp. NPDC057138]|uniref:hypothetical protein n=1 Tax=Promicromonospora sp. NPDC057138 TaxID=3346031 RepID=UPI0036444C54